MEVTTLEALGARFMTANSLVCGTNTYKVLERFYFSSKLKRMSCIISSGSKYYVVSKGAPEKMVDFFEKYPENYESLFREYATLGYRILSLGYRELPNYKQRVPREQAEKNLTFAGFILFETNLKKDSAQAISILKESSHLVTMITGDSLLTACHVAQQVGIAPKPILILEKQGLDFPSSKILVYSNLL